MYFGHAGLDLTVNSVHLLCHPSQTFLALAQFALHTCQSKQFILCGLRFDGGSFCLQGQLPDRCIQFFAIQQQLPLQLLFTPQFLLNILHEDKVVLVQFDLPFGLFEFIAKLTQLCPQLLIFLSEGIIAIPHTFQLRTAHSQLLILSQPMFQLRIQSFLLLREGDYPLFVGSALLLGGCSGCCQFTLQDALAGPSLLGLVDLVPQDDVESLHLPLQLFNQADVVSALLDLQAHLLLLLTTCTQTRLQLVDCLLLLIDYYLQLAQFFLQTHSAVGSAPALSSFPPDPIQIFTPFPQQLIQPVIFLRKKYESVLVFVHLLLDLQHLLLTHSELPYQLLQSHRFCSPQLYLLSSFPEIAAECSHLILILDGQFTSLPADLTTPAGLKLPSQLLQLLHSGSLQSTVSIPPPLHLSLQLIGPAPLRLVLLPYSLIFASSLRLQLPQQTHSKHLHPLQLLQQVLPVHFGGMASLGELPDLHFIVLKVQSLPLSIPDHDAQGLDLLRQTLDLDGLENHHEVKLRRQVLLPVPRQVLDA